MGMMSLVGGACVEAPDDARSAWLASTLFADHQALALRSPEKVAAKYALMGADVWRYFRGTGAQFFRDMNDVGAPGREAFPFATVATSRLWLVGDPHLENVGTAVVGRDDITLTFNDFDAARPGPYHVDVLRLGAALSLLCHPETLADGFVAPPGCEDLAFEMALAYAEAIKLASDGEVRPALRWSNPAARGGVIAEDLFRRAARDAAAGEVEQTWAPDGAALVRGDMDASTVATVGPERGLEVDPALALALKAAVGRACDGLRPDIESVAGWGAWGLVGDWAPPSDEGRCVVLDVIRRDGVGVASHALQRFLALVVVPDRDGPPTRHLVDIKEAWDPPFFRELRILPARLAADNAERIVMARALLGADGVSDPMNFPIGVGAMRFRGASVVSVERGFSVRRIRDKVIGGNFRVQELRALARTLGRLLGEAHARSVFDDAPARAPATAINAAIGGDHAAFARAVRASAMSLAAQVLFDYHLFDRMREASSDPIVLRPVPDLTSETARLQ